MTPFSILATGVVAAIVGVLASSIKEHFFERAKRKHAQKFDAETLSNELYSIAINIEKALALDQINGEGIAGLDKVDFIEVMKRFPNLDPWVWAKISSLDVLEKSRSANLSINLAADCDWYDLSETWKGELRDVQERCVELSKDIRTRFEIEAFPVTELPLKLG